jgi:N-methylhydantoinase A/oxoprolinase/acetone carboxylase beta subunit
MTVLLGVDTGGTYTDAVLLDEGETRVLAKAKALTTRPDLAGGVGAAIDAVLAEAGVAPSDVAMVALSTTLATNALVEGQGGRVALLALGFDAADLERDGLPDAMRGDPVLAVAGGHDHAGNEAAPLDLAALEAGLAGLPDGLDGLAVAARFATRNPAHERAARDLARRLTGLPVTCSHELSSALGGPRRALTAVLNARLVGLIERLIRACEGHLAARGIRAPLMVVRGDGALMAAAVAHEKPIETILSAPPPPWPGRPGSRASRWPSCPTSAAPPPTSASCGTAAPPSTRRAPAWAPGAPWSRPWPCGPGAWAAIRRCISSPASPARSI